MAEDVQKPMIFYYVEYMQEILEVFGSIQEAVQYCTTHRNLLQDLDELYVFDNWGYPYNPVTGQRESEIDLFSIIPL